jgi:hypothetical protein
VRVRHPGKQIQNRHRHRRNVRVEVGRSVAAMVSERGQIVLGDVARPWRKVGQRDLRSWGGARSAPIPRPDQQHDAPADDGCCENGPPDEVAPAAHQFLAGVVWGRADKGDKGEGNRPG